MRNRFISFLFVFFSAFFLVAVYLAFSLGRGPVLLALVLVPILLVLLSFLQLFLFRDNRARQWVMLQKVGYFSMGWCSFLLVVTLARDLLISPLLYLLQPALWPSIFGARGAWMVMATALILFLWGVVRGLSGPHLKEVRVESSALPKELDGLKIAQISDLHIGPLIGRRYVRRAVRLVNQAKADLVVLTGDIIDGSIARYRGPAMELADLEPKESVFFVPGNHEYYWEFTEWMVLFRKLFHRVLMNESELLLWKGVPLLIGGVVDPAAGHTSDQGPNPEQAAKGEAAFKILLAHQPSIAKKAEAAGFDLQLSGHTHGGQFFPWTLVVRRVHQFHRGLSQLGAMWIYVSVGTGSWGPPLRLGTTPEVTLLTLHHREKT